MSWQLALAITFALLIASGFFVAAEFALVGARRHRLEQDVAAGRRGARAAIRGVRSLSLMLAGAQLGITMCMLGLGMVSEPAVHHLVTSPLVTLGLPLATADVAALVFALAVITYLHVVVGEMAPKSWAISAPEQSARLLAPAFLGFVRLLHPLVGLLNGIANGLLRLVRITPRDEIVNVHNREQISQLVGESRRLGLISDGDYGLLTRALNAPTARLDEIAVPATRIVSVAQDARPQAVIDAARMSGRTRVVVLGPDGDVRGAVHAREALVARARGQQRPAWELATPIPTFDPDTAVSLAVSRMRAERASLGLVRDGSGALVGLVSLDDLLGTLLTGQPS